MRKIWVITQRELYETYTDTNLLVIMLITPLALATIIGLALGNVGESAPLQDIPVALVNLDEGEQGAIFETILLEDSDTDETLAGSGDTCEAAVVVSDDDDTTQITLMDLTDTVLLDDVDAARVGVREGTYAAAVIIPANFSEKIGTATDDLNVDPVAVEVYADGGQQVAATVIRSVTESIVGQIARGNITVAATVNTLIERSQTEFFPFGLNFIMANQLGGFQPNFACAFDPSFTFVQLDQRTLQGDDRGGSPLVYFGAAQAMFFLLFTAQGGANSILEDQRQGVLPRMVTSPTPRIVILLGKLVGTVVTGIVQLVVLFTAFMLVGSLISGEFTLIWGNQWGLIALLVVVAALSAGGLGTLLASVAKTPEQAYIIGSTINIFMGALGGAFFAANDLTFMQSIQWLSLVYWGQDAFSTLAAGGSNIWLNVTVLLVQGAAMFGLGLYLFNRRLDQ